MEPSFITTPYVTACAPSTAHVRAILDREEDEYIARRSTRKAVQYPFVTAKFNAPLRSTESSPVRLQAEKPLWQTLLEHGQEAKTSRSKMSSRPSSRACSRPPTAGEGLQSAVSLPTLPSLSSPGRGHDTRLVVADTRLQPRHTSSTSIVKRKLQKHLYNFHTRVVYSVAGNDDDTGAVQVVETSSTSPTTTARQPTLDGAVVPLENPSFLVEGLHLPTMADYDAIFDHDWTASDVERIVRDAVERKRIYNLLKGRYRVVVALLRSLAAKALLDTLDVTRRLDLQHVVPNRLDLLAELGFDCTNAAKFELTDAPLRRDGLVNFVLYTARMVAAQATNPARFRMLHAEGIEISEAIRTILQDYVLDYCQYQDPNHFRNVYLRVNDDANGRPRRLGELLAKHGATVELFFNTMINESTTRSSAIIKTRSGATSAGLPSPSSFVDASTTMSFGVFRTALLTLQLATEPSKRTIESVDTTEATTGPTTIDDNRAMRLFLACLEVSVEFDGPVSTRALTCSQFLEALLRIALARRETTICYGRFDGCPQQATSDLCECTPPSRTQHVDFDAFDDAAEEVLLMLLSHRMGQSNKRALAKVTTMRVLQKTKSQRHVLLTQE